MKKGATAELRSFEYSDWDIKSETDQIHLTINYRTPYSDAHPVTTSVFFQEFSAFLQSAVFCSSHLLITGDFNIHMDEEADTDAVRLLEILESNGLKQHVTAPTHISGHALDLIVTRLSDQLDICSPWTVYLFSDHMLVYSKLQVCKPALKRSDITFRKIRSINNDWKLADVKPRLKKTGAKALFSNLRPISNLSFASKLTERAVFAQTHDHLITNKFYPKAQSAYCEFHSTETALLRVKNDILLNMNQQRVTLLILLYLRAAFETVDHTILLNRLSRDLAVRGMCTPGLSPIFTTDPSPSPSIVEDRINSIQNTVYLRVPVLALYCSSYTQANCLRSSNVTYPMCTPTPTKRNCIYPSMPILELSSRPLYRLCKTALQTLENGCFKTD